TLRLSIHFCVLAISCFLFLPNPFWNCFIGHQNTSSAQTDTEAKVYAEHGNILLSGPTGQVQYTFAKRNRCATLDRYSYERESKDLTTNSSLHEFCALTRNLTVFVDVTSPRMSAPDLPQRSQFI